MKGITKPELLRCNSCSNTLLIINRFSDHTVSVKFLAQNCKCFAKVTLTTFTIPNGNYTHSHVQHVNKH